MNPRQLIAAHEAGRYGINPATVRQWAHRNRLQPRALDGHGRKLYLAEDVLRLACHLPQPVAGCHTESPVRLCPHRG